MLRTRFFSVLSVGAALALVGGVSSAQSNSNKETKVFSLERLSVHPYNATCNQARALMTPNLACKQLGYQYAIQNANIQCVHTGQLWYLDFTGRCERDAGTAPH